MKDENTITGFKEIRSQAIGGGKAGVDVTGDVMAKNQPVCFKRAVFR